jgi:hypothetical protein
MHTCLQEKLVGPSIFSEGRSSIIDFGSIGTNGVSDVT